MSPKKVSTSVRGIGVAVRTRRSTASPLRVKASRWCTPKRCCSSTMASARSWKATSSWNKGMRADDEIDVADGEAFEDFAALAAALPAGEDGKADAGGGGKRRDGRKMLARQNFGRRHEGRLPPGLDHIRCRDERDDGLARADVAVEKPQHARRLRQNGNNVGDRARLRRRQPIRQRRHDLVAKPALGGAAAAAAIAHMPAQQSERELARQQFVIGEPRPRRALRRDIVRRLRPMDGAQRVGKARIAVARQPGCVLPFRQCRQPRSSAASIALRTWLGCRPSVSG